jgi:PAS domain S-box-containing protein
MAQNAPGTAARDDLADMGAFEPALKAARDTIGNLIDSSPFCVYLVDADLRFLHVSDGAKKFFGDERNLLGRDLYEVLRTVWHEPSAKAVTDRFRRTLETGSPYVAARDAAWRKDIPVVVIHELRIERIYLPDGSCAAVCHFHDVTEQRRLESALRDTEERLATQLTAVFRLNELSTITIPAGKIETLYGYMLEAAVALMHSQYASLQLLEADGDKGGVLRLLAHRGFHPRSALH